MKYLALLRGINVGGNTIIKMADLKQAFEQYGFINVSTYINSGNVIFQSDENNIETITLQLENHLSNTFKTDLRIVVITLDQLKKVVAEIPAEWKIEKDLRQYIAFVKAPMQPLDVIVECTPKDGIDFLNQGPGVVYISTKLEGITKSGLSKLAGKKIYKDITIRNFNTVQKILLLMQKD